MIDISLGGPDSISNLWPLEQSRNANPDQYISPATGKDTTLPGGDGGDHPLQISTAGVIVFNGKYFVIKRV